MKRHMININEVKVVEESSLLICYGLGSCIALFLYDRLKNISGGAHIALPSGEYESWVGSHILLEKLLSIFTTLGSDLSCLKAKITGGANIYGMHKKIGEENYSHLHALLINKKIFLAASDVGGRTSRTARYNTSTGELMISTGEYKTYSI
jgi:chemotaxis protein CheD